MKHSPKFEKLVTSAKANICEISIDDFIKERNVGKPVNLIDVREDNERNKSFIEGSIHLSKGIIERDIEKTFPNQNEFLVLYCGGGYRSALACDNLQKMGYKNVHSLQGGFRQWQEKGLPICQKADCNP